MLRWDTDIRCICVNALAFTFEFIKLRLCDLPYPAEQVNLDLIVQQERIREPVKRVAYIFSHEQRFRGKFNHTLIFRFEMVLDRNSYQDVFSIQELLRKAISPIHVRGPQDSPGNLVIRIQ